MRKFATAVVVGIAASGLALAGPALAAPAADDAAPGPGAPSGSDALAPGQLESLPDDEVAALAEELPLHIHGGAWPTSHVQGIALDRESGHMYWSFTQMLVKTDLDGNVVGTVEGITGHLGSLDLNKSDGRVFGSLEYKADEAFYIAIFDGEKIDRVGMDAESDGVMTTVHLQEVVDDYTADMDGDGHFDGDTADTDDHRYGCSGIDGIAFGPQFGSAEAEQDGKRGGGEDDQENLMVAYGVYSNTERTDNDHQVILEYDISDWHRYEKPLNERDPHRSGPEEIDGKYFTYTGNTRYGVQNLEYDPYTGNWLMAVYAGEKEEYPNYTFFMVDGSVEPQRGEIKGQPEYEEGDLLTLAQDGLHDPDSGTWGWEFHGDYGIEALGDGYYYFAEGKAVDDGGVRKQDADVHLHRWTGDTPAPFERVADDAAE